MKRLSTLLFCLFFFSAFLSAQPYRVVSGLVKDNAHQPVADVEVHIKSTPCGLQESVVTTVSTNPNGYYRFEFLDCIEAPIEVSTFCAGSEYIQNYDYTPDKTEASLNFTCGYDGTVCEIDFGHFPEPPEPGLAEYRMRFEGQSLNGVDYRFSWNFGDATWGEGPSVIHDYQNAGGYTVCLDAFDGDTYVCTVCKDIFFEEHHACDVDFSDIREPNPDGSPSNTVRFEAHVPADVTTSLSWYFGDGTEGVGDVVDHEYSTPGTYSVCLIATDDTGYQCEKCREIFIEETPVCEIDFSHYNEPNPDGSPSNKIRFEAQMPGGVTATYNWDFGDGGTDGGDVVVHEYTAPGNYRVCVFAYDGAGNQCEQCKDIFIDEPPVCEIDFSHHREPNPDGSPSNKIRFEAQMPGGVTATYNWDFGDGGTDGGDVVVHEYTAPGNYRVCVFAYDGAGNQCEQCKDIFIDETPVCEIDFSHHREPNPDGSPSNKIRFEAQMPGGVTATYNWDFGDGGTDGGDVVVHEYTAPGNYRVCVFAYDGAGNQCEQCKDIFIDEPPVCEIDFSHHREPNPDGSPSNKIRFEAQMPGGVTATYNWDFGDGGTDGGDVVVHEYTAPGNYRVCVFAYDGAGNQCEQCKDIFIDETPVCEIDFSHHREPNPDGSPSNKIRFEAQVHGTVATTIHWDFGDGNSAEGEVAFHEYAAPGSYRVCVITYDENGNKCEQCREIFIEETPICEIDFSHYNEPNPDGSPSNKIRFEARIPGGATATYNWDFGDGGTDGGDVVVHEYTAPGNYRVCVFAYDDAGNQCEQCKDIFIDEPPVCEIDFSHHREPNPDGSPSNKIRFEAQVHGTVATTIHWDFGDGNSAEGEVAFHEYAAPGSYRVCVITYDENGNKCEQCREIFIEETPICEIDFSHYNEPNPDGSPSNKIRFEARIPGGATATYNWDFGDGGTDGGDVVVHEYTAPGNYRVCVFAYDGAGNQCEQCKDIFIDEPPVCEIDFSHHREPNPDGSPGNKIRFEAQVHGTVATTIHWDFGDGNSAEGEVAFHEYAAPGSYRVCVITYDENGNKCEQCREIYIDEAPICEMDFSHHREPNPDGTPGSRVRFEAHVPPDVTVSFNWDFGDGNVAGGDVVMHEYTTPGNYWVCLFAYDEENNRCEKCKDIVIEDAPPCYDPSLIDPNGACPDVWDPVCGCDGITYANSCEAEKQHGLLAWTAGPCPIDRCQVEVNHYREPASDGSPTNIVHFEAFSPTGESYSYKWIFGDGQEAEGDKVTNEYPGHGTYHACVEIYKDGQLACMECKDIIIDDAPPCYDPNVINPDEPCPDVYEPVCGCDGVTYKNACEAKYRYGVVNFVPGECDGRECEMDISHYREPNPDGTPGSRLRFEVHVPTDVRASFNWDFGDGNVSSGDIAYHEYRGAGTYTVCVFAYDEAGNQCERCIDIIIDDLPPCHDPNQIDPNAVCPDVWQPVCGCDGVTYANLCEAEKQHGVMAWTPGPCPIERCRVEVDHYQEAGADGTLSNKVHFQAYNPTGENYTYKWIFGDGNEAEGEQVVNDYPERGIYHACLEIFRDGVLACRECTDLVIGDEPPCEIEFEHHAEQTPDGSHGFPVRFKAHSWNNQGYTFKWNYGDSGWGEGQEVVYDYRAAGTYTVCLDAYKGDNFECTICRDIVVGNPEPCFDPNRIDETINCPDVWEPVCGCDGITYANACEAKYRYGIVNFVPGECDQQQCDLELRYILQDNPDGGLSREVKFEAEAPADLNLTYHWDFGDGHAGGGPAVEHKYERFGRYMVCVTAYDENGTKCTRCKEVILDDAPPCYDPEGVDPNANCPDVWEPVCGCDMITYDNACVAENRYGVKAWTPGECPPPPCEVDFDFRPEAAAPGSTVFPMHFKAHSFNGVAYAFKWNYGEGSTGEGRETLYEYPAAGTYTVCLDAYNGEEYECTICKDIVVGGNDLCFDQSQIDPDHQCPDVVEPVCGCNGMTYVNACEAKHRHGIVNFVPGPCPIERCRVDVEHYREAAADGSLTNRVVFVAHNPTGESYSYRWIFGDGNVAEGEKVVNEYPKTGTYRACLEIFRDGQLACRECKDIFIENEVPPCYDETLINPVVDCNREYRPVCGCDGVTYKNACIAKNEYGIVAWVAGACPDRGCQLAFGYDIDGDSSTGTGLAYKFSARTLDGNGEQYSYKWDFGDGQVALGATVRQEFVEAGIYKVCVEAWDGDNNVCSWCEEVEVNGMPSGEGCQLAFGYHPGDESVDPANPVHWYDFNAWTLDGNGELYTYKWSFGDGREKAGEKVSHDYTAAGTYRVCVEAYDGDRFVCSWCDDVRIDRPDNEDCRLAFRYHKDQTDAAALTQWYKFEARTLDGNSERYSYKWDFGDGQQGSGWAIRHEYTSGGTYQVCVEAWDGNQFICSWCSEVVIDDTPDQGCQLAFAYEPDETPASNGAQWFKFNAWTLDGNGDRYSYRWRFGDGRESIGRDVRHEYTAPGVYKVCVEAYIGDHLVCSWCSEVVVEEIPEEGCQVAFGHSPDLSITDGKYWYDFKAWTQDGSATAYRYRWTYGDGNIASGDHTKHGYRAPGAYVVCVDAYDGDRLACSWCKEIRVEEEILDEGCQLAFGYEEGEEDGSTGTKYFNFEAWTLDGNSDLYTYKWDFGDGNSGEGTKVENGYTAEGVYEVCVEAYDGDHFVCSWCDRIKIEEIPVWLPCELEVSYAQTDTDLAINFWVNQTYSKYHWDFGDGTSSEERAPAHSYPQPGNYFICLEVIDWQGQPCSWCELVDVTKEEVPYEDPCLDEGAIDLDFVCPEEEQPVCGCDGKTYPNSCVAENLYGIKEWVDGPCNAEEPGDSIVICEVNYEYSVFRVNDTTYLIEFFTTQDPTAYYFWDFGDGEVSDNQHPIHYYIVRPGEDFAMTACLYIIRPNDLVSGNEPSYCIGTYCETLVIDDAPDAIIEGTITSGGPGLRRQVIRRSGEGEPLPGVKVQLIDVLGQVIGQSTTDDEGQYSFEELLFGNYRIQVKIEGVTHDPYPVKLDPLNQEEESLDFEVTDESISTGVEDQSFVQSLILYPNPTRGFVQMEFELPAATKLQVKVTNLFGQTLSLEELDYNVGQQKVQVDLNNYASGVYWITLSTPAESISKRVIVQE